MPDLNPEFVARVAQIAAALDTLDYFQLLRIGLDAEDVQIRAGYHQQARAFHPDRFQHAGLPELAAQLATISKRITEAYVVLRDPEKRARYRKAVSGPERAQRLRYTEDEERQAVRERRGPTATTGPGRQMLEQAQAHKDAGNPKEALKALRLALLYEKDNDELRQLLASWEGSTP